MSDRRQIHALNILMMTPSAAAARCDQFEITLDLRSFPKLRATTLSQCRLAYVMRRGFGLPPCAMELRLSDWFIPQHCSLYLSIVRVWWRNDLPETSGSFFDACFRRHRNR